MFGESGWKGLEARGQAWMRLVMITTWAIAFRREVLNLGCGGPIFLL